MTKELFADRRPEEIEAYFATWEKRDFEDIPADTFFEVLADIETQQPAQHIEIEGELVDGTLVLTPPRGVPLPFTIRENEIILGDYYITIRWKSEKVSSIH